MTPSRTPNSGELVMFLCAPDAVDSASPTEVMLGIREVEKGEVDGEEVIIVELWSVAVCSDTVEEVWEMEAIDTVDEADDGDDLVVREEELSEVDATVVEKVSLLKEGVESVADALSAVIAV
jgi:hypothetical protein